MARIERFNRGEWLSLLHDAHQAPSARGPAVESTSEQETARKRRKAERKVRLAEVSHARQELTAAALAPSNDATLAQLTNEAQRPRRLSAPIPVCVLEWAPPHPVDFDRKGFLGNVRSAHRGVSGGPSDTHKRSSTRYQIRP